MTTYLLDTNIIIDALNDKKNWNAALIGLVERGHTLACCAVNIAEVYAGVRPKEEQKTAALLHSLRFYPITFDVAELSGRFKRQYSQKGKTLAITDTMLAAVAIHYQLSFITDNAKDFPMPEISLFRSSE
jgi:predicted nucleic acid-binding protein